VPDYGFCTPKCGAHNSTNHTVQYCPQSGKYYTIFAYFRKGIVFWKVPRLRPFVVLVRATCTWRREWGVGGMTVTGGNRSSRIYTCPSGALSTTITHRLACDLTWVCAVTGRRLATWATTQPIIIPVMDGLCHLVDTYMTGRCVSMVTTDVPTSARRAPLIIVICLICSKEWSTSSNKKFHKDPSSGSWTIPCSITYRQIWRSEFSSSFSVLLTGLKIARSAHTVYLCVLCGSENRQRLFPYTALTDWFL